MNSILEQMLDKYENTTVMDRKNSVKEVVQEIVLCGLSRAGFFDKAAFYGGTALRIFYGLDRFSEDLDFSLKVPDDSFSFEKFIPVLEKEIHSYGLNFRVEEKEKTKDSAVRSAFLKGNTKEHMLIFFEDKDAGMIAANEMIKVKFEVDTNPPQYATYDNKYQLLPIPYQIVLYDMPSLFAGKLHAVLCRGWKSRIKGRDLYDYVFYMTQKTPFNIKHLQARLEQTGQLDGKSDLKLDQVKEMLEDRFDKIDILQAKEDILPFIKNPSTLDVWSVEFFKSITQDIKCK